jgi:subtilisin family serine protease
MHSTPRLYQKAVCGHGTGVASNAAGNISGVAKGATLAGINVYNSGSECLYPTTTGLMIAGVDYVIDHKSSGPNVINLSLAVFATDQQAPAFATAIAQAINSGITVISTASNDSPSVSACTYEAANVAGVITVGATSEIDSMSSYSDYGPCVTLLAPGDHTVVADNGNNTLNDRCGTPAYSNVGYCTASGTSQSAAIVSGIAALYLQNNPHATPAQVYAALRSSAVAGKISLVPSGTPNLLASVWVPGNYSGKGPPSSGGGAPPGAAAILIPTIFNLVLATP